jgi:hypothetical protein
MAARRAAVSERTSSPFHRESRGGSLLTARGGAEMSAVVLLWLLLGHTKLESTVRYLGIEVDDALSISEQVEL